MASTKTLDDFDSADLFNKLIENMEQNECTQETSKGVLDYQHVIVLLRTAKYLYGIAGD